MYITSGVEFQGSFHSPCCGSGWNIILVCERKKVLERISIVMGRTVNLEKTPGGG